MSGALCKWTRRDDQKWAWMFAQTSWYPCMYKPLPTLWFLPHSSTPGFGLAHPPCEYVCDDWSCTQIFSWYFLRKMCWWLWWTFLLRQPLCCHKLGCSPFQPSFTHVSYYTHKHTRTQTMTHITRQVKCTCLSIPQFTTDRSEIELCHRNWKWWDVSLFLDIKCLFSPLVFLLLPLSL